jgi:hypothetical protein
MLYALKNYSKFIRPGAVRIESNSDHVDVLATAYLDKDRENLIMVMINKSDSSISVELDGITSQEGFDAYRTSEFERFKSLGKITGEHLPLAPKSITTFVTGSFGGGTIGVDNPRINTESGITEMIVYPNPVEDLLHVIIPEHADIRKIIVTDMAGRTVLTKAIRKDSRVTLPANRFEKGVYFIHAGENDKKYISKFMVK